ncbi:MAG: HNH endonuclease [Chlorobiaceae bacterium]|nr:HNH endonuclease [Chlorobiaceae bacterium]
MATLVHHIDRDTDNWTDENLVCLCKRCHEQEHRHEVFRSRESGSGTGGDCEISRELS